MSNNVQYNSEGQMFKCFSPGIPLVFKTFTDNIFSAKSFSDPGEEVDRRTQTRVENFDEDYEIAMNTVLAEDENLKAEYTEVSDEGDEENIYLSHGPGVELDKRIRQFCHDHNLDFINDYDIVMNRILESDRELLRAYSEEG